MCLDGCIAEYYGKRCLHACISNCETCTGATSCTKCKPGYYGDYCKKCPNNCLICSSLSNCDSCKAGFYNGRLHDIITNQFNSDCRHECKDDCKSCTSYNMCIECEEGFYSGKQYANSSVEHSDCRYRCQSDCKTCTSYNNCTKCVESKYNNIYSNCTESCLPDCKACTSYDTCTECVDGKYNTIYSNCSESCKLDCKACTTKNTCTKCVNGKYNNIYSNCSEICPFDCKACISSDNCSSCHSGKYGVSCQDDCGIGCVNHQCDFRSGNCTCIPNFQGDRCDQCVDGTYGPNCNISCPSGCANNSCNLNGNCLGCKAMFSGDTCECGFSKYGTDCNNTCPPNCKNSSCNNNGECYSCKTGFSGDTCDECVPEKYGAHCNLTCPTNCNNISCQRNGECYSCKTGFSGVTCDECVPGKYGTYCNLTCPTNCNNISCKGNGECYSCKTGFSGVTCDECVPGKYGTYCNLTCPTNCNNISCQRNGECYSCKTGFSGVTCDECVPGKYGTYCNLTCPTNCNNISCQRNGECYSCKTGFSGVTCDECVPGKYGTYCNLTCPTNCNNISCQRNGECYSCKTGFSGVTCDECVPGKYGTYCNLTCPTNCNNISCQRNRECYSCKTGFSGVTCDECFPGKYGTNCDIPCTAMCENNLCRRNGECYSCISGFSGSRCNHSENAITQTGPDGDNMGVTIGAAAGGGVFVLIIISVIVVVVLRERRKGMGKSEENDMTEIVDKTDHVVMKNSEVMTSGISDETNDPVYAVPNKPKKQVERTKSSDDNTSIKAVSSPNYEKPKTQNDIIVMNQNDLKQGDPTPESDFGKTDSRDSVAETTLSQNYPGHLGTLNTEVEEEIDLTAISSNHEIVTAQTASAVVDTYYNVAAVKRRKNMLDQLPDFVSKKTNDDFADEFQQLPPGLIKPYVDSQRRENIAKNRYRGIYPYDCTRIVLRDCSSDYINASYIDGYNKRKAYIASIGPTYKYMGDMSAFWIMVWQEKVGKIVMLTKLDEGGAPKCDQYWPEKGFSLLYANIQVTCQSEETYADYIIRSFTIQKDSEKRTIFQVHFTAWPDKGTPDDVTSLIEFCQRVNSVKTELEGPILVHCSAGIGRTGTYIALDSLTEEGEAEGGVDIYAFVRNMREQRVNMVQTAEQYQYLHNALVHTLTFDSKAVEASKFAEYMKSLTEDHLGKKFEKLQASVEQRSDDEIEAVKRNIAMRNKNRDGADIPGDRYRPKLYLDRHPGSSDFINAVYVNSYKAINRFLVAQTPLPDTVVDFLTLIVQEKVSCIVSMEANAVDDKTVGTYTADNQQVKIGTFTVKTQQKLDTDQYVLRILRISHKGKHGTEEVTIPHIQFTHWNDTKNTPEEPAKFVEFIKDVELKLSGNEAKGPILVHCLTGAEKSGIFCVVSILLEKIRTDQEISVVNTIRQIKYRRHKSIPNKDQYIFCHKCVNEYIRSFDSYSNFEMKT
ncbi:multiple epidermal growth factor-like domains protein 11 [Mercenaria mercenaria]|uniref:multiple epidermal growth factor-like domains protein 11 n=1 Tax=Mercenaria mercenaria TaxID=6596 RepID=UPI00234E5B79|nr:multiple epidermal growth factor-like domains protein 11 [Mercenaria mercenaria]